MTPAVWAGVIAIGVIYLEWDFKSNTTERRLITVVKYAFCLPLCPGERLIIDDFHIAAHHDALFNSTLYFGGYLFIMCGIAPFGPFHPHRHVILPVFSTVKMYLILTPDSFLEGEDFIDMTRIDVDSPDDEHIIRSTQNSIVPRER